MQIELFSYWPHLSIAFILAKLIIYRRIYYTTHTIINWRRLAQFIQLSASMSNILTNCLVAMGMPIILMPTIVCVLSVCAFCRAFCRAFHRASRAPVLRCAIAPPCVASLPVPSCACLLRIFTLPLLLFLCLRSAAILVLSFAAPHCASTVLPALHMHSTCALRACFACVLSVLAPSFFVSTVGARFSVSSFPCFQSSQGFSYNSYIIILKL